MSARQRKVHEISDSEEEENSEVKEQHSASADAASCATGETVEHIETHNESIVYRETSPIILSSAERLFSVLARA